MAVAPRIFTIKACGARLRVFFRQAFRQTPPQREPGWVRLDERMPSCGDARYDGRVELYNRVADSLSYCDFRTLEPQWMEYWWRPLREENPDRHFHYARDARSCWRIFGPGYWKPEDAGRRTTVAKPDDAARLGPGHLSQL